MNPLPRIVAVALLLCCSIAAHAQPITVIDNERSDYQIYHAPDAPLSVQQAAIDLQRCVVAAGDVMLPINSDAQPPDTLLISLGDNAASWAAGLSVRDIPLEGYRIATRRSNIYILGPDTADGEVTAQGGTSHGTRNGVYAFLEEQLNVRWLMPGDVGEDIPKLLAQRWVVEPIDRTDAPAFVNRRIPYIQPGRRDVQRWQDHMRLGYSLRLSHGHNWRRTVPAEQFDEHPDWFAMSEGRRVPPVGRYKLETTNPELVAYFAQRAIDTLHEHPEYYTYSLSPSDSRGWSQSPESKALYETDPYGGFSNTPAILDFYRNVARIVKQGAPDGAVAGYIYSDYIFPPNAGVGPLPDNLYLVIAPSFDYGYTLYRDDIREKFDYVINTWSKATDKIAFYDLPTNLSNAMGAPTAPGLDIMAFQMPRLADAKIKGVYIYGQTAWGQGAMHNYILACMMWNPRLHPDAVAAEYCVRAYGNEAGTIMFLFYQLLDHMTRAHYRADPGARYVATSAILQDLYAAHWPRIESQFLAALAVVNGDKHRARLAMYEQCMQLFYWNLTRRGLIEANPESPLYRTDEQVVAMLSAADNALSLSPAALLARDAGKIEPLTARLDEPISDAAPDRFYLRGPNRLLISARGDDEITITPYAVKARGNLVGYRLIDSLGNRIAAGILADNSAIRFTASEGQVYLFSVTAGSASYGLKIDGAPWAVNLGEHNDQQALHFLHSTTPVYFHVPAAIESFSLTLTGSPPGETAAAEIINPAGDVVATMDSSEVAVDRRSYDAQPGWWTVRFVAPTAGIVDAVYLTLAPVLPQWVSLDPRAPLIVEPLK